jgi:two-component system sensor histidine kinase GlrK
MRLKMPRTITGLVATGFALAVLPVIGAVLFAGAALNKLTHQTESLLDHGILVTRLGTRLRDDLVDLERSARQYVVLRDPRILELNERRWQAAEDTIERLRVGPGPMPATSEVGAAFEEARESWHTPDAEDAALLEAADRVHALLSRADALVAAGREEGELQILQLRAATATTRRQMLACALTLIPLGALLAWGFSIAVTRPVKQMFHAIAELGRGRYEPGKPIEFPSELRPLGHQIEWLRRRLARLEADKDRFLRQVSHELKTPLASLREGSELLREGALGELTQRQGEVAAILCESTSELESLIDNLLAYSEWRAERQESQKAWFESCALIEEVLSAHRLWFAKRELHAELDLHEERLFGLRTQMRIALDNLITNSVKHSPQGGRIQIGVSAEHGEFVLSVRDFGRGVADAENESIFEPFVRGSETEEQGIRGTGIGLSIVRETLFAHDGSVVVEDAHPGARFVLRWPCPIAELVG